MFVVQMVWLLTAASAVVAFCPKDRIHNIGGCSYRLQCRNNIRGMSLPEKCMEATNDPNKIEVTLTDAIERFDDHVANKFLAHITTLKIHADWPQTQLSILHYTTRLQHLFLAGNNIQQIHGNPFYTLAGLESLDLSHNKLDRIDNLFKFELQPNKLKKLQLSHNRISFIGADDLAELTSLNGLDLSHNSISNLTVEPFANLTSLEVLNLSNNSIINLNGAVNNLRNLKHFYLKGNQIENIDSESLQIIIHLLTFDVSSNHLDRINSVLLSRHWDHLGEHAVFKIILSGNHISFVPNATLSSLGDTNINIRSVRHVTDVLTEVDLSDNSITTIEYNAFQSLVKLTSLDLSKNRLTMFSVNADDVAFVKYLNLSQNYISQLYFESFSLMNNLQNLDLSHNSLEYIPDQTFIKNVNLKYVNMTHNEIRILDALRISMFHADGGVLDLSNNYMSKLTIPSGEGLRLTVLVLHSNNISDPTLINLRYQTDLKNLDMSHNQINELRERSLMLPTSLTSLDLSYNGMESIAPSAFIRVNHLETLHLAHNHLKAFEYGSFRSLSSLINLDLSYNQIKHLDSKMLMDLKSLSFLSLKNNGLDYINDEIWYGHGNDLMVFLDGNNLTCTWLARALKNAANGYSKMHPTVHKVEYFGHTLEGIPCVPEEVGALVEQPSLVMADERLLWTTQKILEEIKNQSFYLRTLIWRMQNKTEKMQKLKSLP